MNSNQQAAAAVPTHTVDPIFVVGYMHSGTTLVRNILRRNATLFFGGGESKYFDALPMIRRAFPNLRDDQTLRDLMVFVAEVVNGGFNPSCLRDPHYRDSDEGWKKFEAIWAEAKQQRDYGLIFRIVSDQLTRLSGKMRWLEKSPSHIFHIDEILACMPDALFVETVRDPRDVLASKKTRRMTVWETDRYKPEQRAIKHLEKAYDPVWDSLSWKSAIRAGWAASAKYPGRVIRIRYEDLVADPEPRVRELCDFLNLEFEPGMLDVAYRNPAEWQSQGKNQSQGITAASIGRWRRVLTPTEIALCQWLLEAEFKTLEYGLQTVALTQRAKIPGSLLRSAFTIIDRLFRRGRWGGFSFLVKVLFDYWRRLLNLLDG